MIFGLIANNNQLRLDVPLPIDIVKIEPNLYHTLTGFVSRLPKMYPGYSGIVQYGHRTFLMTALGFALLVNVFLITNFYWTALLSPWQRNGCLAGLFTIWCVLTVFTAYWKHRLASTMKTEEHDRTFQQTIMYYLQGDWFAVESQILPYLKKYPKDVEMLLLQATMYRHTERYEEALLVLDKLQLLQDSRHWYAEIEMERSMMSNLDVAPSKCH